MQDISLHAFFDFKIQASISHIFKAMYIVILLYIPAEFSCSKGSTLQMINYIFLILWKYLEFVLKKNESKRQILQNCYCSHWSINFRPFKARVEWIGKKNKSNSRAKVGMSTALGTLFKERSSKIRTVISFLPAAQWLTTDLSFQNKIVYKIVLILGVYRSTLKITAIILKTQAYLLLLLSTEEKNYFVAR